MASNNISIFPFSISITFNDFSLILSWWPSKNEMIFLDWIISIFLPLYVFFYVFSIFLDFWRNRVRNIFSWKFHVFVQENVIFSKLIPFVSVIMQDFEVLKSRRIWVRFDSWFLNGSFQSQLILKSWWW